MEELLLEAEIPHGKVYTANVIYGATFIAGPLVATYMIAENFRLFNNNKAAARTWIVGIVFTIILFGGLFMLPEDVKIPNMIIPLIYTGTAWSFVKYNQERDINKHLTAGGKDHNWKNIILVALSSILLSLAFAFGLVLIDEAMVEDLAVRKYGASSCAVYYSEDECSATDVDKVARALRNRDFFQDDAYNEVLLTTTNTEYVISIALTVGAWENPEVIEYYTSLLEQLEIDLPDKQVQIFLCNDQDMSVEKVIK